MRLGPEAQVLLGRHRGDPPLPDGLRADLREWAAFAVRVRAVGTPQERDLVADRGRLLAARVAGVLGRSVPLTDPLTGEVWSVRPPPRRSPAAGEPAPWATGLVVALFAAVWVALADVVLSRAFAEAFGLLWIPANLVVTAGLAPSLYLLVDRPFWRWIGGGAAAGLVVAWVLLLLGLLG